MLCVLMGALLCTFCAKKDELAGGYDDVENPAIQVSLQDAAGKAYGDGELRIYARYQNPGKDSLPVLQRSISGGASVLVRDTALVSAMTLAAARGTPWPNRDTLEFNLCAIAPAGEAFLGDFLLVKGPDGIRHFLRRSGSAIVRPDAKGVLAVNPIMAAPVLNRRGNIGLHGAELRLKSMFIPGSPYGAGIAADGSFSLARMAAGKYDVKAVSLDSLVYTAADSLSADAASTAEYAPSNWAEADILWIE